MAVRSPTRSSKVIEIVALLLQLVAVNGWIRLGTTIGGFRIGQGTDAGNFGGLESKVPKAQGGISTPENQWISWVGMSRLRASTIPPPASKAKPGTVEDLAAQLEPFGVSGVSFCDTEEKEEELAVCCTETRRLMDCTVDMYASINGTKYCVALPIFSPVSICYHKGERMIPVENECELMDRLYDFLGPTLEQEDLFLIRSPVCLTLDGDLGDLGDGEFSEEELQGWEEYDENENPWEGLDDGLNEEEGEDSEEQLNEDIEKLTNPQYWDDADAEDVEDTYGQDWEKVAAFTYDGVDYTMVKILEPVLVLAKEDPTFKGITKWVLPSEDEAEEVAPIMEALIKVKLGIEDEEDDD